MNETLLEAFRHSAWATKELLGAARGLAREQLTAPGTATGTERGIPVIGDRGTGTFTEQGAVAGVMRVEVTFNVERSGSAGG